MGICYRELKNYELAVKNLEEGIELTENEVIDLETKEKWLLIGSIFLASIEQFIWLNLILVTLLNKVKNLSKCKEFTNKCFCDLGTKRNWLTIAELFLAEIMEMDVDF